MRKNTASGIKAVYQKHTSKPKKTRTTEHGIYWKLSTPDLTKEYNTIVTSFNTR